MKKRIGFICIICLMFSLSSCIATTDNSYTFKQEFYCSEYGRIEVKVDALIDKKTGGNEKETKTSQTNQNELGVTGLPI